MEGNEFKPPKAIIGSMRLGWTSWNEVCEFVPKAHFLGGVYLDDVTKEVLQDGRTSNTMGLHIATDNGVAVVRENEYIVKYQDGTVDTCGILAPGQVWKHTTGDVMRVLAVCVRTRMYGLTNLCEHLDTGEIKAVYGRAEDMVNWTLLPGVPAEFEGGS